MAETLLAEQLQASAQRVPPPRCRSASQVPPSPPRTWVGRYGENLARESRSRFPSSIPQEPERQQRKGRKEGMMMMMMMMTMMAVDSADPQKWFFCTGQSASLSRAAAPVSDFDLIGSPLPQ